MTSQNPFSPQHEPSPGVALVTGAAQRLGRAIALALAADGWDVVVHYRQSRFEAMALVDQIRTMGRRACTVACDFLEATDDDIRAVVDNGASQIGPVRCLVNSASRFEFDLAGTMSAANLDAHVRANVTAPVLLAQALHRQLPEGHSGVVINLLDQKLWNPNPDFFSYSLSKSALESATGLLARALAPQLRVVGLAPGISMAAAGQAPADFAAAHRRTPLGHASTPQDIAQAAVYLARAQSVTGTTLLVDGGQHLAPSPRDILFLARGHS
jgi:NAD(P)-dependent dehydrogenase (short-subunit alcohol dehydrogenase family)